MSNFDYILELGDFGTLHQYCAGAESEQTENPREAARLCKMAIEETCRTVIRLSSLDMPMDLSLSTMLDTETLTNELSRMDILNAMRQVRRRSNATANLGEDMEGVPYVVELLFHIVGTVMQGAGLIGKIPQFEPQAGSFMIPGEDEGLL